MELEEMKSLWETMSQRVEKLEITNKEQLMEMTQIKYRNKFQHLLNVERLGGIICFIAAVYITANFDKLNTWYLMLLGILCVSFMIIAPLLTFKFINDIKKINISNSTPKETLVRFTKAKRRLLTFQRYSIVYSFVFFVSFLPVSFKILKNRDLFVQPMNTTIIVLISILTLFLLFMTRWGYKKYKNVANSAERVLKELDE